MELALLDRATAGESLRLTWLGNAGFLVDDGETSLLIDPYLADHPDRRVAAPVDAASLGPLTGVLATHEHADHLDPLTWRAIGGSASDAVFVLPEPVRHLADAYGIPGRRVIGARPHRVIRIGAALVTPVPSLHGTSRSDAYGFGGPRDDARFLGYVVELAGAVVYHAGDTLPYEGLAETLIGLGVDVALLPINGRDWYREQAGTVGNLTEREAAVLAQAARVRLAIPMHYELFTENSGDAGRFVSEAIGLGATYTVVVPAVGRPVVLGP